MTIIVPAHPVAIVLPRVTAREQEVLSLAVSNLTNHQIARRLHIVDHTVLDHLAAVRNKAGSTGTPQRWWWAYWYEQGRQSVLSSGHEVRE